MKFIEGTALHWKFMKMMASADERNMVFYDFVEKWAELMEEEISSGKKLEDIVEECAIKAYKSKMRSGFLDWSVEMLNDCWIYGNELKEWRRKLSINEIREFKNKVMKVEA